MYTSHFLNKNTNKLLDKDSNKQVNKCVNKRLVKDNASSFNDCEGHSRNLMRCARRPKALPRSHIHAFIPAHLRSKIYSIVFTPSHSHSLIHAVPMQQHSRPLATYAVALTLPHFSCRAHTALTLLHSRCSSILSPLSRGSIYAAALSPPHFCRSIHASACIGQHLCCRSHAPAFTLPHLCCSIYAATFLRCSIDSVALSMPYLCHHIDASACTPL